jgi:hypothetical protein
MHKYQLAIENYEFSGKDKSKSIMNIITHYKGQIDDANNSTIYFGFPSELEQLCTNASLNEISVCSDIWIDGVKK